jgi:probable rRNA maturation factor
MIDIDNQSDFEIEFALLVEITKTLTQKDLELIFTNNSSIQKLNKEHRNIDEPTDVLSFPLECDFPNMLLGSIVEPFVSRRNHFVIYSWNSSFIRLRPRS